MRVHKAGADLPWQSIVVARRAGAGAWGRGRPMRRTLTRGGTCGRSRSAITGPQGGASAVVMLGSSRRISRGRPQPPICDAGRGRMPALGGIDVAGLPRFRLRLGRIAHGATPDVMFDDAFATISAVLALTQQETGRSRYGYQIHQQRPQRAPTWVGPTIRLGSVLRRRWWWRTESIPGRTALR